jgi:hypothetical protein
VDAETRYRPQAASEVIIEPGKPDLSYYLELYPREGRQMSGSAVGVVRRADGKDLATFELGALKDVAQPQPLAASLSVAGLPAGSYMFDVRVQLADTAFVRSHPFRVLEVEAVAATGAGGYWASLTDQQVAEFDAVVVWLSGKREIETYKSLSPAGKRQFLARQFANGQPWAMMTSRRSTCSEPRST